MERLTPETLPFQKRDKGNAIIRNCKYYGTFFIPRAALPDTITYPTGIYYTNNFHHPAIRHAAPGCTSPTLPRQSIPTSPAIHGGATPHRATPKAAGDLSSRSLNPNSSAAKSAAECRTIALGGSGIGPGKFCFLPSSHYLSRKFSVLAYETVTSEDT